MVTDTLLLFVQSGNCLLTLYSHYMYCVQVPAEMLAADLGLDEVEVAA